ncbi:MAG: hypothetical protein QM756_41160 [Polyangiaceae bacterium]
MDKKGSCTAPDLASVWTVCVAPTKSGITIPETPAVVTVNWSDVTGGMPATAAWSASTSPDEIVGLQWQFPWSAASAPYSVDITIDDITLIGGTGSACPTGSVTGGGGAGSGGGSSTGGGGGASASGGAGGASSSGGSTSGGAATTGGGGGASNSGGSTSGGSTSGGAANSGGSSSGGAANSGGSSSGGSSSGGAGGAAPATDCPTYCDAVFAKCPTLAASTAGLSNVANCKTKCPSWPTGTNDFPCWRTHVNNATGVNDSTHCPHATGQNMCSAIPSN